MKAFTTLLALASAVNAHMIMRTPKPAGSPDSSPLSGDGSNFPCKIPGGSGKLDDSNPNVMTVGAPNTLSFTGSAVHGGGSCQISIAKGLEITKSTKFMVIHSIEGGCPADAPGNLAADPQGTGAGTFQFAIPDHPDLGPGDYTLAWTWNNKIGNREFYMNCAYVQLQAPQKKRYAPSPPVSKRQSGSLPDMFVANLGNGCSTAEGIDVKYPDPGSSLEVGADAKLGDPTGSCGAVGAAQPDVGGASSAAPVASSPAATPVASNSANPVQPSAPGFATNQPNPAAPTGQSNPPFASPSADGPRTQTNGGSFATATGAAGSQSAPVATPVASSPAASNPAPVAPAPSPSVPNTSGSSMSGVCSSEGDWYCAADGKSFQRCASGSWSASMAMAAGLTCVPGQSSTLEYNVSGGGNAKRDIRSHISRRRHNVHGSFLS